MEENPEVFMCKRATESPKMAKTHDTFYTYDTFFCIHGHLARITKKLTLPKKYYDISLKHYDVSKKVLSLPRD